MDLWAGEARKGTHIPINSGLLQTLISHKTKLQKKKKGGGGNKKTELEAVTRHI